MKNKGILIVVSGFSGAGKGTLMTRLIEKYDTYALSVSMTTREAREGEIDGINYFFLNKEEFEKKINENALVEYANYCGNYYGTPREYVEQQLRLGKDVILEIEIQGALKIKQNFPNALLLFVMPPDVAELKKRLVGRGTETLDVIEKENKLKIIGTSDNPYVSITDFNGAVIDPTTSDVLKNCFKQKRWGIGPQVGVGVSRDLKFSPPGKFWFTGG